MIISNTNQASGLEPGNETNSPCPDQLRSFPVSISKIHADGDRRSTSPTGGPATNREEDTVHARGSNSLILGFPDLSQQDSGFRGILPMFKIVGQRNHSV